MLRVLLLANLASTLFLVGLIWTIQLVHYPLFARVGAAEFAQYQAEHMSRMTSLVFPLMVLEFFTALALAIYPSNRVSLRLLWIGFGFVVIIWVATIFLSVPRHNALLGGYDATTVRLLIAGNWLRTIVWTARGALMLYIISKLVVLP